MSRDRSEPRKTIKQRAELEVEQKIEKQTKPRSPKARVGNSPVIGDTGYLLDAGDNSRYLAFVMQVGELPDIKLSDPAVVSDRLKQYFGMCVQADMKPTVSGFAMCLGLCRQELYKIVHNQPGAPLAVSDSSKDVIKKGYRFMENLWEAYMQNGKINPVSGIFLGKNQFGYRDQTDYVITPNDSRDSEYNAEDIRHRYLIDSGDSGSDSETPSDSGDSGDSERL